MQAWESFLQAQEVELGTDTVQKWLRSMKILKYDALNLYLEAKDSFQALWFEEHIRAKADAKFLNGNQRKISIHLSISSGAPAKKESKYKTRSKSQDPAASTFQLHFDELDPNCTFENFCVCEENEVTYKLLKEIKLGAYNPIYLYGTPGSGKTHLLISIAQALRSKGLRTTYVRAETFTDHVVSAIRAGEMSLFRHAYRNIDMLLVDDVHVFARKGATQEEFFHTFNTLHLAGKQIILTANCSPQELQLIEPRLVSRFEWGIVLPLKTIKQEEQLHQMVKAKTEAHRFPLSDKLITFLIETFTSTPKALVKALEALILRSHIDSRNPLNTLSVASVKVLLNDLIIEEEKSALTPMKIVQSIAEHFGIRSEDILGKAQTKECTFPRQLAMHLNRVELKMPYVKIGDLFGRDHSTVMSSIKRIQSALDQNDLDMINTVHAIQKKLHVST